MKITDKLLSIPPYISTSWNYIKSIQMKGSFLVITLIGGESINIPNLKNDIVDQIFNAHADYLEKNSKNPKDPSSSFAQTIFNAESSEMPFKLGIGPIEGIGNPLIHNPSQKDAPEIPKQILQKITAIVKIISPEEILAIPKAEPHCNCLHCQIMRSIHQTAESEAEAVEHHEDEVKEEDLKFQQWDVMQTGDKLFNVINRLDTQEKYSVYLGHPVGCTCGKSTCEHIIAVLKS